VNVIEAEVVRLFPELAKLALLPRAGWRFQAITEDGRPVCLVGWRAQAQATDALWIFDRHDCLALRMVVEGVVWKHTGELATCVEELLALPAPHEPAAPRLVRARAPSLWTP
jgi:hypothetical protein